MGMKADSFVRFCRDCGDTFNTKHRHAEVCKDCQETNVRKKYKNNPGTLNTHLAIIDKRCD